MEKDWEKASKLLLEILWLYDEGKGGWGFANNGNKNKRKECRKTEDQVKCHCKPRQVVLWPDEKWSDGQKSMELEDSWG